MLRAVNIHKSFDTLEVLKGIDLTVNDGEIVAVVGPSGAGKTTLLQILGTLDTPTSGNVYYGDTDISTLRGRKLADFRCHNIGFVFQFHQLLPEFNVIENVMMPALIGGRKRSEAEAEAKRLIEYMGLSDRISHRPNQLSGGERQRAAVARALINNPAVILADEPSGSLDSANRKDLHRLFFDLRRDMGTTFVIVTHDNNFAADADRIITIKDGKVVDTVNSKELIIAP